ncbi:fructosamine kinase family protein [Halomarina salina]|uniref:Fructosamine kinase family protein n=1 Tax=Halomarina salina TaxID=1872699 RepID=A0ABD5RMK5_9EURY
MDLEAAIESALGSPPVECRALTGGQIGTVQRATLADDRRVVAKTGETPLDTEGRMLRYLAEYSDLPVPTVYHADPDLLLVEFIEGETDHDAAVARDAADHLAALHEHGSAAFGLDFDTVTGPVHQPNPWTDSWVEFYREHRLEHLLSLADLSADTETRVEAVCDDLTELLTEPKSPSLIHGDVWTTNVLARDGAVTAFLDPAIYYAHPEVELAYVDWTGTFGDAFFDRYRERREIVAGFFESRRFVYRLYPLLVHVHLFGGRYHDALDETLSRIDY